MLHIDAPEERKKLDCSFKPVNKDDLENMVCKELEENLFTDYQIDYMAHEIFKLFQSQRKEVDESLQACSTRLEGVNRKINNLVEAIATGLTFDSLKDKLQDLEHQKHALMFEMKRIEGIKGKQYSIEFIKERFEIGKNLSSKSDKEKTMIIDMFVDKIIVSDAVTLHYKAVSDLSLLSRPVAN